MKVETFLPRVVIKPMLVKLIRFIRYDDQYLNLVFINLNLLEFQYKLGAIDIRKKYITISYKDYIRTNLPWYEYKI